jgi:steroid 5-alpha reductase family enzyme
MSPRAASVVAVAVSLALGAAIAAAGSDGGEEVGGLPTFVWLVIVAFGVNLAVYIPSFLKRTEHYFDLTGSITYVTVIVIAITTTSDLDARTVILGAAIGLWAGRLGTFLFRRVTRDGGDGRFDTLKLDSLVFLRVWVLQGLWVTITAGAALAAMTSGTKQDLGIVGVGGLMLWVVGFVIEVTADRQKSAFKADKTNDGRFIATGLWAWSRHPNYFGEITLWLGIAILAVPALDGWQVATLISPLFVFVLLTRVSGVPLIERRGLKRWGDDPEYQAYLAKTPVLMLRPPSR